MASTCSVMPNPGDLTVSHLHQLTHAQDPHQCIQPRPNNPIRLSVAKPIKLPECSSQSAQVHRLEVQAVAATELHLKVLSPDALVAS